MTYSKEITLWCDANDCDEWATFQHSAVTNAVKQATDNGWSSPNWNEHYCPRCTRDRQ